MNPTYKISASGSDPAETLQIVGTVPTTQEVFRGSIKDLRDRIATYPAHIKEIQDKQTQDEALLASLISLFTTVGVTDLAAPLTLDHTKNIETQNIAANETILQQQSDVITTKLTDARAVQEQVVEVAAAIK